MNLDEFDYLTGQLPTTYAQDLFDLIDSKAKEERNAKTGLSFAVWAENFLCRMRAIQLVSLWPIPAVAWPDYQYLRLLQDLHDIAYGSDANRQYWASQHLWTKKAWAITKDPNTKKQLKAISDWQLVASQNGYEPYTFAWEDKSMAKQYRAVVSDLIE